MIFIDLKIFETGEVISVMLDENVTVKDMILHITQINDPDTGSWFVISERTKLFLSKNAGFKSQGITGGDRLIFIRRVEEIEVTEAIRAIGEAVPEKIGKEDLR